MLFTTVNIEVHGTLPYMYRDEVIDGKFYNFGVQAYTALKAHKAIDIHTPAGQGSDYPFEEIIPYHAVTAWKVTKEEGEYTKPEDDFCKPVDGGSDGDGETIIDGTFEFTADPNGNGQYNATLSNFYNPSNVTVVFEGEEYNLPKASDISHDGVAVYGEFDNGDPVFTTYPVSLAFMADGNMFIAITKTEGNYSLKVIIPQ